MDLLLRPTVIGGDKFKDDYCVFHEGRSVGRIMLTSDRSWQGVVLGMARQPASPDPAVVQWVAGSLEMPRPSSRPHERGSMHPSRQGISRSGTASRTECLVTK